MKPRRILLLVAGGVVVLGGLAVGLAFTPGVQTWAVRRQLAAHPALGMTVGRVRMVPGHIHAEDVRIKSGGTTVMLPAVDVAMPLLPATRGHVRISQLVAKGWKVSFAPQTGAAPLEPIEVALGALQSVFHSVRLPVDFALDAVELEGELTIPESGGQSESQVRVIVTGGDLSAGRVGAFTVKGYAAFAANAAINALSARGSVELAMDTPRTFSRTAARLEIEATGARFQDGTRLTVDAGAGRAESGDSYTIQVDGNREHLIGIQGRYLVDAVRPGPVQRMSGVWKVNLRDTDLAPFTLGFSVPEFTLEGEGSFQADAAAAEFGLSGELKGQADKLGIYLPALAAIGPISASATFDFKKSGEIVHISSLGLDIGRDRPIALVRALQPFEIDIHSWVPQGADPSKDLVSIDLQGVPSEWIQGFLPEPRISATGLGGEFRLALLKTGVATLRSARPVTISGLAIANASGAVVTGLDVTGGLAAEYSELGWQAELRGIEAKASGTTVFNLEGRAGSLAGQNQPVKFTGTLGADLPALLRQPFATGQAALSAGRLESKFTASLGSPRSVQATLSFDGLVARGAAGEVPLPKIDVEVRADFAATGAIALKLPIAIDRNGRKSDLLVDGSVTPTVAGVAVTGRISSDYLSLEDASTLGAALGARPAAGKPAVGPAEAGAAESKPFWTGVSGEIALALKKVSYAQMIEATNVGGWIRISEGAIRFDQVRAAMGNGSDFSLTGGVTFDGREARPYALKAALAINDYELGGAFRALHPDRPPAIEGKFNITSQLAAAAATPGGLGDIATSEIQLTSRGGVFRLLRSELPDKLQANQSLVERAGNFLGSATGIERISDYVNLSRIVSDIGRKVSEIPYDQMSVTLSREADANYRVRDFTVIAPEARLQGTGRLLYGAGQPFARQPIELKLQLGTRGDLSDLMRRAGLLNGMEDNLGYSSFLMPLTLAGTVDQLDTTALKDKLLEAASASPIEVLRR